MRIIVGLGNPGKRFVSNRHNVGFMVLDKLAEVKSLCFKRSLLNTAFIAKKNVNEDMVMLVKPFTFMNRSGRCLSSVVKRFNVNLDNILVVYDDVDLDIGKIRFKTDGSSAGHKGMGSIIGSLGTEKISRLRIGIGRPKSENCDISDYVLSDFNKDELENIRATVAKAAQCCWDWVDKSRDSIMQEYNS